jgi:hypothetical protein
MKVLQIKNDYLTENKLSMISKIHKWDQYNGTDYALCLEMIEGEGERYVFKTDIEREKVLTKLIVVIKSL